jgi:hypothetical protein
VEPLLLALNVVCARQRTITQRKGDTFYRSVSYGFSAAFAEYVKDRPVELGRDTATGRALLEGKVVSPRAETSGGWPASCRRAAHACLIHS